MSNPTIIYKVGLQFYRCNYHNEYNNALFNVISHHAAKLHATPDRTHTYDEKPKYFVYLHIKFFPLLAIKIAPSVWMLGMGLARNEASHSECDPLGVCTWIWLSASPRPPSAWPHTVFYHVIISSTVWTQKTQEKLKL